MNVESDLACYKRNHSNFSSSLSPAPTISMNTENCNVCHGTIDTDREDLITMCLIEAINLVIQNGKSGFQRAREPGQRLTNLPPVYWETSEKIVQKDDYKWTDTIRLNFKQFSVWDLTILMIMWPTGTHKVEISFANEIISYKHKECVGWAKFTLHSLHKNHLLPPTFT